jgi:cAMP phosphodiesterase
MKIEVLGAHNTETDKYRLPCLLVDDVIALDAGALTTLPLSRQQAINKVLLTHHHFDHTRDLIILAANGAIPTSTVDVYGLPKTLEIVYLYLFDGNMYRDYTAWPSCENPRIKLKPLSPGQLLTLGEYSITPFSVSHSVPTVGYLLTDSKEHSIFYTGDTGNGLSEIWQQITPEVLFIEVAGLNSMREEMTKLRRHLTPSLLVEELIQFQGAKGYIPRVVVVHIPTLYEEELRSELIDAGKQLGMELELAYEGLVIEI